MLARLFVHTLWKDCVGGHLLMSMPPIPQNDELLGSHVYCTGASLSPSRPLASEAAYSRYDAYAYARMPVWSMEVDKREAANGALPGIKDAHALIGMATGMACSMRPNFPDIGRVSEEQRRNLSVSAAYSSPPRSGCGERAGAAESIRI